MRRRWWLVLPVLLAAAGLWYGLARSRAPQGQPPLAAMELGALQSQFNQAVTDTRVILLLSPT